MAWPFKRLHRKGTPMGSEQWTSQDVERWRRLGAAGWVTGLVAVVWLAGHVAFYFAGPPPPSQPASMWWLTLALTGLVLMQFPTRAVLVVVLAVVLAAVEASWFGVGMERELLMVGVVASVPVACALRAWYLRYARTQQRRYAASRALMQVPLPSTRCVRPFSVKALIVSTLRFAVIAMVFVFPALAVGALDSSSPSVVLRTSVAVVLAFLAVFVADRALLMRTAIRSASHLSSGMHVGIPVEAMIGAPKGDRKVEVFVPGSKEPFTRFLAWDPPDQPSSLPTEQRFAAVLYGELCTGGWAAVAAGGVIVLPEGPLGNDSSSSTPPSSSNAQEADEPDGKTGTDMPAADRTPQDGPIDGPDDDGMPPTRG